MKNIFYSFLMLLGMTLQTKGQVNGDDIKVSITNLGETVNTPYDDYAPVISADGMMMIFTSRRPIFKEDIAKERQGMENVYVSYYDDMTWKWSEGILLGETVNQEGRNNSAIALSNDGQRMLLYRGDPDGNIYESVLRGEEWSEPVKLPEPINSKRHESTASISPDGRTIYFVSNRKGGEGGLDVWLCNQDNTGNWGKAENLGSTINTSLDEEGVFIHPDGKTLYFSSKGHNTIGGFDIFISELEHGSWSVPVNLGNSINTPGDDLFFTLTADGKTGYYSTSNTGKTDSKLLSDSKENTGPGSIIKEMQEAQVLMEQQVDRVKHAKLVIQDLPEEQAKQAIKEAQLQLVQLAERFQMVVEQAQAQLVLKEILVRNTNDGNPRDSTIEVNTNDDSNSSVSATLAINEGGFGKKDIYELYFKNKKAESRLTLFKGVVLDEELNPVGAEIEITDNDKNIVIATIQSNSVTGKYLVSLPSGKNYGIAIKRKGYLFHSENFNIPDSSAFQEINKNILVQKFDIGNSITLKNVFYDYGQATLKPESISELNQLVKLMNLNIDIKIEVASHTDSQSSDEFNLTLSQARSQSVLEYLFSAGISKDQVVAKGYGEANPIASNDTEEGRKLNRRTEIKVLEQ